MYLLDINICVAILRNDRNVLDTFYRNLASCYLSTTDRATNWRAGCDDCSGGALSTVDVGN